jgi:hypothetical protein
VWRAVIGHAAESGEVLLEDVLLAVEPQATAGNRLRAVRAGTEFSVRTSPGGEVLFNGVLSAVSTTEDRTRM